MGNEHQRMEWELRVVRLPETLKRAKQCLGPYISLTIQFRQKAVRDRGRLLANRVGPEPLRFIPYRSIRAFGTTNGSIPRP